MLRRRTSEHGFAMVDLLTALAVALIGLCGIFALVTKELADIRTLYQRDIALMAAKTEMDILRSLDFSELKNCTNASLLENPSILASLKGGKGHLSIRDYAESGNRIKEVTVNISWEPLRGRRKEIKLTTLICDMSLGKK